MHVSSDRIYNQKSYLILKIKLKTKTHRHKQYLSGYKRERGEESIGQRQRSGSEAVSAGLPGNSEAGMDGLSYPQKD